MWTGTAHEEREKDSDRKSSRSADQNEIRMEKSGRTEITVERTGLVACMCVRVSTLSNEQW